MRTALRANTFVEALEFRAGASDSYGVRAAGVIFFTILTAAAAQISVPLPFTPVPFTFQPMVVLLAGLTLGARLGAASQVLYLALGLAGFPVFAASAVLPPGALRMLGPTGGYLMSYPAAAFVVGSLARRGFDRHYGWSVIATMTGLLVIYACGATWLGLFARVDGATVATGFRSAVMTSVVPFVPADILKLLAAAAIVPGLWKLLGRRTG